jgi:ribonucleotide reductase alpha subunit
MRYSRVEKTLRILDYGPVYRYLNVCVSGKDTFKNCSVCSKCCRTLLTLELAGKTDMVKHLFDIEKYYKEARRKFVSRQVMCKGNDLFAKDLIDFAGEKRIKLPNRTISYITILYYKIKNINIKKLKNLFKRYL